MPAAAGLECSGYPTYRLRGYFGDDVTQLQTLLNRVGRQTVRKALIADLAVHEGRTSFTPQDPVDQFVKAEVMVVKDGYTVDEMGRRKSLAGDTFITVRPQHAHGGEYSYGPMAEFYAKALQSSLKNRTGQTFQLNEVV